MITHSSLDMDMNMDKEEVDLSVSLKEWIFHTIKRRCIIIIID